MRQGKLVRFSRWKSSGNLAHSAECIVTFYNQRGACEQHIKEGKNAITWTVCHAVRSLPRLSASSSMRWRPIWRISLRILAISQAAESWSLTSLREKLIKIDTKVIRHGRYVTFQM